MFCKDTTIVKQKSSVLYKSVKLFYNMLQIMHNQTINKVTNSAHNHNI